MIRAEALRLPARSDRDGLRKSCIALAPYGVDYLEPLSCYRAQKIKHR
jgi:hypothetical protein